jgi:hypothetical protein
MENGEMKEKPKARVRVTLSPMLRHLSQLTDEPEVLELQAASPLECLQLMIKRYPSMKKWAYKDGDLLPVIWFFVNDPEWKRKLPPDEFEKPLKEGDELIIAFGKL